MFAKWGVVFRTRNAIILFLIKYIMQGAVLQIISMFLIMGLGLIFRIKSVLSDSTIRQINKFTIHYLFPSLFFVQIVGMDLVKVFNLRFILAALTVLVATYLLSWGVASLLSKDRRRRVAATQLIYVANLVVVGIPMVDSAFGNPQYNALAIVVLFFGLFFHNIIPITQFELVTGSKESVGKIILRVFKNPIVASIIIAAVCNLLDMRIGFFKTYFAQFLLKPMSMLGHTASTMVFLCIGYNMHLKLNKSNIGILSAMAVVSLIVVPLVTYGLAMAFSLPHDLALVLTIMFASPTAPYIYNIMMPYDLELDLTQHAVVVTMIGYLVTMPVILMALGL